jgi:hypothetical protein
MFKFFLAAFLVMLTMSGCSLLNPGYMEAKPNVEKFTPYKNTLADLVDAFGTPAITHAIWGEQMTYTYFYATPQSITNIGLMQKGNYSDGCKNCGSIKAVFSWNASNNFKSFVLRGFAVSDEYLNADIDRAGDFLSKKNYKEAYPVLLKAAQAHSSLAQQTLGLMYINGDGVEKNYKEAAFWFARAAGANYQPAMYDLAVMFKNGEGVPVNIDQAIYFFTKSAEMGYLMSMHELIKIYKILDNQKQVEYWSKKYDAAIKKSAQNIKK